MIKNVFKNAFLKWIYVILQKPQILINAFITLRGKHWFIEIKASVFGIYL